MTHTAPTRRLPGATPHLGRSLIWAALAVGIPGLLGCPGPSGLEPTGPDVELLSPGAGAAFPGDATIPLCFLLADPDNALTQLSVSILLDGEAVEVSEPGASGHLANSTCFSDGDRPGVGLYLTNLPPGSHVAEVRVRDPQGQSAEAQVHFSIRPDETPPATPSPTPSPTPGPEATPAPETPTPPPSPSPTPGPGVHGTATPTEAAAPTDTPTEAPTATPPGSPTDAPTPTATASPTEAAPTPAPALPRCAILSPAAGRPVLAGAPLAFSATATDADDAPDQLFAFWTASPGNDTIDGRGGFLDQPGTLAFESPGLPVGTFAVTLTVQDPSGHRGICGVELTTAACVDGQGDCAPTPAVDGDGDGVAPAEGDCDDADPAIHPGAEDSADGVDSDCDGRVDEDAPVDVDGDGISPSPVPGDGDCDDEDPGVYPGAPETPDDVDEDCDGLVDEGTIFGDDDGDGYSEDEGDCDDTDSDIAPGLPDSGTDGRDDDCDGAIDEDALGAGALVVTEVRSQLYGEGPEAEDLQWFEVHNPGEDAVPLAGLDVEITHGHPDFGDISMHYARLPGDAPDVPPGGYRVIGRSTEPGAAGGATVHTSYGALTLDAMGGVALFAGETLIDRVRWDEGIFYPTSAGASITLDPDVLSGDAPEVGNDSPTAWCPSSAFYGRDLLGTPGAPGDLCR